MTYLFVFFTITTLLHYLYDSVVVPTLRLRLRYKLFAIRDEVRWLMIQNQGKPGIKALQELHASVNGSLLWLPAIDFHTMLSLRRALDADSELSRAYAYREELFLNCEIPDVPSLRDRMTDVVFNGFLVNSGAWFIYLVPLFMVVTMCEKFAGLVRKGTALGDGEVHRFTGTEIAVPA